MGESSEQEDFQRELMPGGQLVTNHQTKRVAVMLKTPQPARMISYLHGGADPGKAETGFVAGAYAEPCFDRGGRRPSNGSGLYLSAGLAPAEFGTRDWSCFIWKIPSRWMATPLPPRPFVCRQLLSSKPVPDTDLPIPERVNQCPVERHRPSSKPLWKHDCRRMIFGNVRGFPLDLATTRERL